MVPSFRCTSPSLSYEADRSRFAWLLLGSAWASA